MAAKRPYRKSVFIPLALLVYTTGCFIYLIPRNPDVTVREVVVTVGLTYAIIAVLWWLLRKKERLAKEREEDVNRNPKHE